MQREPDERRLPDVPEFAKVSIGDKPDGLVTVQRYLVQLGYLAGIEYEEGVYNASTATAIRTFQRLYSLTPTGEFNLETKLFMQRPRCAMPDTRIGVRFSLTCCWPREPLSFAFDNEAPSLQAAKNSMPFVRLSIRGKPQAG